MTLRNRLVRSATFEGMADAEGVPSAQLAEHYERLARGGVGLIITGYAYVSRDGRNNADGMAAIDRDALVPIWRSLVDRVHAAGAPIALQIAHCGRQTTAAYVGGQPMGPSAVFDTALLNRSRAMSEADIERVIDAFGQAARRAKEAGFDAVQVHGAHGYLINQFLSPHSNRRRDRWGGTLDNRMRFVREVYKRCRAAVGEDYPILIKLSAYDAMRRGIRLPEGVQIAEQLAAMGIDGIEVSSGVGEDGPRFLRGDLPFDVIVQEWQAYRRLPWILRLIIRVFGRFIVRPPRLRPGFNLEACRAIKSRVQVPVFSVGGITEPEMMREIIERGDADYVSLSRALIANPKLPKQIEAGAESPSTCIHCNLCFGYMGRRPLRCYHGKRRTLPPGSQTEPPRLLDAGDDR
jgi:2,4-dienoyl-CoA reductase-like NADH-dependent reductase (Old Yellow Enzyme family)